MQSKTIGMRELRHQLARIARAVEQGQSFLVTIHNKTAFRIVPPKKHERDRKIGKRLVDEFKPLQFKSGNKHLSQKIDEIVYYDRR
ncbi:type II toxin-antitoxin system Phd/YefM family antitoxin [Candidatus Uhrbacteria bacterium]|nr:type II toxin-antitoxin system Phd/YefM family antitoxin [Candidatus Uhrbacteria bacterium]